MDYAFAQNNLDYSLFVYATEHTTIHVLVYIDDLIITGNSVTVIADFKEYLSSCFHMNHLGILRYFLGIEVARNPSGIYFCQRKYALDLISETRLLGVKPVSFPLEHNHKLALADGELLSDPTSYRHLIGKLIYLGTTRP